MRRRSARDPIISTHGEVEHDEALRIGFSILQLRFLLVPMRWRPDLEVIALPDQDRLAVQVCELAQVLRDENAASLVHLQFRGRAENHTQQETRQGVRQVHRGDPPVDLLECLRGEHPQVAVEPLRNERAAGETFTKACRDRQAAFIIDHTVVLAYKHLDPS